MKSETKKKIAAISLSAIIASTFTSSSRLGLNIAPYWDPSFDAQLFTNSSLSGSYEEEFEYQFLESDYVPQGLCMDHDHIYVSMYDFQHHNNSIIKVFDYGGHLINSFVLDNKAHVGGIAYDEKNNLIWVSASNGRIEAYKVSDVLYSNFGPAYYKDLNVGDYLPSYNNPFTNAVSFLTIDGDDLYVGCFSLLRKGRVKKYNMVTDPDKTIHLLYDGAFYVPSKVQGMAFYEKDSNKYMLLSKSYGTSETSKIQIFNYNPEIEDYSKAASVSIDYPPMIEQIAIKNGLLYSLYESNAKPYKTEYNARTLRMTKIDDLSLF